jgi:hypothetical protein
MTDSLHSQLLQMADDMIGPYRNLAFAAAKELQLQTWQPIESAPKDRSILAYQHWPLTEAHRILTMAWDEKDRTWRADVHSFIRFEPTHWMPLPSPPSFLTSALRAKD